MTKIVCISCSKSIKVPVKYLRVCRSCKKPVCKTCSIEGFCRECGLFLDRNTLLEEYFEDKYRE